MTVSPTARIKARALALGFDAVGVASVTPLDAQHHYEAWLAAGRHAEMRWLASEKHRQRRQHPELLVRDIRSVLCVALCYPPERQSALTERLGSIARYAAGEDYHHIMRDKLYALEGWIRTELFPGSGSLWYSDTGAILERGWAERAGLGWIGKHSGLLSRTLGSWFLLGEVLMDRELEPDTPLASEHCGTCTRCVEVCPTRAIVAPYQVDARRCISYLTIEHKGAIPRELRRAVGDWIFGCDLCQDACPWNRFAPPARESRLHARALEGWSLDRFLDLDEPTFRTLFADSPIRRAGRAGFVRNVCVALGNRRQMTACEPLLRRLSIDEAPIVRGHAAWALGQIASQATLEPALREGIDAALDHCTTGDIDAWVREEATLALAR
ncbi:MAG: tRNA epoxyqueuosine(34) reductase QueG [Candidatus Eisenbacteria bacterium]